MDNQTSIADDPRACASKGTQEVLAGWMMCLSHCLVFIITGLCFGLIIPAISKLQKSILPYCAKKLLIWLLVIGNVHGVITVLIRLSSLLKLYSVVVRNDAPCLSLYKSSNCFVVTLSYYYFNYVTSSMCITLFLDQVLTRNPYSFFYTWKRTMLCLYLVLDLLLPAVVLTWIFYDANLEGHVVMCNYPPVNVVYKFHVFNIIRLVVLFLTVTVCWIMNFLDKKRERRIHYKIYDTGYRFASYNNYRANQLICWILTAQSLCLVVTSIVPLALDYFQEYISEKTHHLAIAFSTGVTYSNFLVSVIIINFLNSIRRKRHSRIETFQRDNEAFEMKMTVAPFADRAPEDNQEDVPRDSSQAENENPVPIIKIPVIVITAPEESERGLNPGEGAMEPSEDMSMPTVSISKSKESGQESIELEPNHEESFSGPTERMSNAEGSGQGEEVYMTGEDYLMLEDMTSQSEESTSMSGEDYDPLEMPISRLVKSTSTPGEDSSSLETSTSMTENSTSMPEEDYPTSGSEESTSMSGEDYPTSEPEESTSMSKEDYYPLEIPISEPVESSSVPGEDYSLLETPMSAPEDSTSMPRENYPTLGSEESTSTSGENYLPLQKPVSGPVKPISGKDNRALEAYQPAIMFGNDKPKLQEIWNYEPRLFVQEVMENSVPVNVVSEQEASHSGPGETIPGRDGNSLNPAEGTSSRLRAPGRNAKKPGFALGAPVDFL